MASVNKGNPGWQPGQGSRSPLQHTGREPPSAISPSPPLPSQEDKASGERREETEWHRVVMYNRLAEIAGEYLKKGRPIYIEGPPEDPQVARQGHRRRPLQHRESWADQMQMLGGRDDELSSSACGGPRPSSTAGMHVPPTPPPLTPAPANLADLDDDIPSEEPVRNMPYALTRYRALAVRLAGRRLRREGRRRHHGSQRPA